MPYKAFAVHCSAAVFVIVTLILTAGSAFAQWGPYRDSPMGFGMMGGMGWLGIIFMVIFWCLVIVSLILLVKWLLIQTRSESSAAATPPSLEILKARYARGEIDQKEFEEKKRDLLS